MAFNSIPFLKLLAFILPIYWILVWLTRPSIPKYWLVVASFIFWAFLGYDHFRNLQYVTISVLGNYLLYFFFTKKKDPKALWLATAFNLGILLYYSSFFFEYAIRPFFNEAKLFWPIGISFYSLSFLQFHSDLLRRSDTDSVSKLDFVLFGSFFPASNAGPILRWREFGEKLTKSLPVFYSSIGKGCAWILLGLVKKTYLAELLMEYSDPVFRSPASYTATTLWIAFYANAAQLYLDFSGYVDMGRGAAKLFGYRLPRNFRFPFFARSVREVLFSWNRTLAVFFRGSVYPRLQKAKLPVWISFWTVCILYSLWYRFSWEMFAFSVVLCFFLWMETRISIRKVWQPLGVSLRIFFSFHMIGILFTMIRFAKWELWADYWRAFLADGTRYLDDFGLFAIVVFGMVVAIQVLEMKFRRFFL